MHTERLVLMFIKNYRKMNDTREFIIDEAYKLFLTRSYEAVSISTISNAIGLTKGALYHHFVNKEDLFKAVIDKHFPSFKSNNFHSELSLKETMDLSLVSAREILETLNPKGLAFNPISFIRIMSDAFSHYPEFSKHKLTEIDESIIDINKVINNAIANGEIRSDINPTIIAKQIYATIIGVATEILRNKSISATIENLRQELSQFYQLLKK